MWRYVPSRLKECLKSNYSQTIQPRQHKNQLCCFARKSASSPDQNDGQFNGKKENSQDQRGKTWEPNAQIQQRNWIGALGWSGILVLGWYLSQPCHFRTLIGKKKHQDQLKYVSPAQVFVKSVLAQPLNQILPKESVSVEKINDTGSQFVNEALDQAVENFARAHGSVENRLGVELARRKRHKDAAGLFQRAADRGHATAAFNLGLCHELGLGTLQDFRKAAEYYELASLGGHATATYNLGVFYVHGWGGKVPDHVRARQLFITAAHLGQVDARKALGMTETKAQRTTEVPEHPQSLYNSDNRPLSKLVNDTIRQYTSLLEA